MADDLVLPVALQTELLVKVASYDRNFPQRAGEVAKVLVVTKPGNGESSRVAAQLQASLSRVPQIAGLPHQETIAPFSGAAELANTCRAQHIAIAVFAPGFREDIGEIREAFDGLDILTAGTDPDYVPAGIVLGFDVAAGRPQLLVHLTQAKQQNVAFRSDVLRLTKVFQ
jgi:beta-phosphoglucomutase-like phosphatase (HAD superfamily)